RKPRRNSSINCTVVLADAVSRYPIIGIAFCCARAASGAMRRPRTRTTASPIRRMSASVGMAGGESSRPALPGFQKLIDECSQNPDVGTNAPRSTWGEEQQALIPLDFRELRGWHEPCSGPRGGL